MMPALFTLTLTLSSFDSAQGRLREREQVILPPLRGRELEGGGGLPASTSVIS